MFDTGAASSQVRRSEARSEGAALQLAAASEMLAFRTAQAYLKVNLLTELMRIGEENVAAHERTLRQIVSLAEDGVAGAPAGCKSPRALRRRNPRSPRSRASSKRRTRVTGISAASAPGALVRPKPDFLSLDPRAEPLIERALAAHPAVRAAERELEAAQAKREFARSRLGPPVNLELGVTHHRYLECVCRAASTTNRR